MLLFTRGVIMSYNQIAIGQRLQNLRAKRQLSQKEVSANIGIDQSTYSRLENGMYDMPLSVLFNISNYYGVSIKWLLGIDSIPELTDSECLELEKYKRYIISLRNK